MSNMNPTTPYLVDALTERTKWMMEIVNAYGSHGAMELLAKCVEKRGIEMDAKFNHPELKANSKKTADKVLAIVKAERFDIVNA